MAISPDVFPKDFIFSKYPPDNPIILLKGGEGKAYKMLISGDEVFIREKGKYVPGKVTQSKHVPERKNWVYRVSTPEGEDWRSIGDYQVK